MKLELEDYAKALKELGHPSRLKVYKRLAKAGRDGLPVGTLQKELEIPGSTLSHHISALVSVGLVKQKREGRILYCIPQFERFDAVIAFLCEECCADEGIAQPE
ncbi:ArsR/SmtB family transcription factor [Endozoicomonas lisbonensis]|uniref:DNA-binding transcriptional ArsR family regulator n=1 Tax=Endozoicomonas lisbonensis TaxID=3120522 RepID=A0ABV2SHZ4_9GAMM